jgi:hypothetical protein
LHLPDQAYANIGWIVTGDVVACSAEHYRDKQRQAVDCIYGQYEDGTLSCLFSPLDRIQIDRVDVPTLNGHRVS